MKKAFTLAEVLITLGIIGVVVALTMPTLIAKHQKKVIATRLKANFSIFSQAILSSQRDNGELSTWPDRNSITKQEFEQQYLLPYLSNPNETKGHIVYTMLKSPSKNSQQSLYWFYNNSQHHYQLANGTIFTTGLHSLGNDRYIALDVNGTAKPNIMGKDVFVFNIRITSKPYTLTTAGYGRTKEKLTTDSCAYNDWGNCNFCTNNGYAGQNCASLIALNNWEITDDYPW